MGEEPVRERSKDSMKADTSTAPSALRSKDKTLETGQRPPAPHSINPGKVALHQLQPLLTIQAEVPPTGNPAGGKAHNALIHLIVTGPRTAVPQDAVVGNTQNTPVHKLVPHPIPRYLVPTAQRGFGVSRKPTLFFRKIAQKYSHMSLERRNPFLTGQRAPLAQNLADRHCQSLSRDHSATTANHAQRRLNGLPSQVKPQLAQLIGILAVPAGHGQHVPGHKRLCRRLCVPWVQPVPASELGLAHPPPSSSLAIPNHQMAKVKANPQPPAQRPKGPQRG